MKLLLDTCTFVWLVAEPDRLSQTAAVLISDSENDLFLSSVTAWELGIKVGLRKLTLPQPPHIFVPRWRMHYKIEPLPLLEDSVLHLHGLPQLHSDPFDRMLICQSLMNDLRLLTPDQAIHQYAVRSIW